MKETILGSDGLEYIIAWFKVARTNELYYQIRGDEDKRYYGQLVMAQPYSPDFYINDLAEALRADAPKTIKSLKK